MTTATIKINDLVSFKYNDKTRRGTVEQITSEFVKVRHDNPATYNGKKFSTYRFNAIQGHLIFLGEYDFIYTKDADAAAPARLAANNPFRG